VFALGHFFSLFALGAPSVNSWWSNSLFASSCFSSLLPSGVLNVRS
jgi:hypothetical protein